MSGSRESDYVIGIDGGGTRSRGIICRLDGCQMGQADGGPLNFHTTSYQSFRSNLKQLCDRLREGMGDGRCRSIGVGTAALFDDANDRERARALEGIDWGCGENIFLVGDAVTAAAGACEGRHGILVISGTGSIGLRLMSGGGRVFSGGLGPMLGGDPGSANWMAARAIRTAQRRCAESGELCDLGNALCHYFEVKNFAEIVSVVYGDDGGRTRLAGAAAYLAANDRLSDQVEWTEIETAAGRALADLALPLLSRSPAMGEFYVAGSVLNRNDRVRESMKAALESNVGKSVQMLAPNFDAVVGAVCLAFGKIEARVPAELLDQFRKNAL